ncbi:MAG: sigma-70 family RNA polymerase sigma factor [Chloroflexi bacterium]|nr:sigma-70 family RNA polymerase sigma factor [Chloroflexota bacterium]BCY19032.1 RNA polymerase sigma factor [Leptolinea sp. HRD-7]
MLAGTLMKQEITGEPCSQNRTGVMNDLHTDNLLIQRVSHQDEAAFHELYEAYGQRMYAYALRITGDPVQAEDVLQDSLVVVWNMAGSFRGTSRLKAWLLGIVHNTAMKTLRHTSNPITEEMINTLQDERDIPEDQVQQRETANRLRNGMAQLSPEHRAVLDLVFYQGLSLQETADVAGCPVGTVKSRLSYARNRLKGLLTGSEDVT